MKPSKQEQKFYNKFLKSSAKESEVIYKTYKNLFEVIRKKSKKPITLNYLKNVKMI